MIHDTHCHIDLYPDPLAIATRTERRKIATVAVTNLPSAYFAAKTHMARFRYLRLAVGLHPLCANDHTKRELNLFKKAFDQTQYVGEVGLDFSRHGIATKEAQLRSFRFVVEQLAQEMRFVTLHSRRAERAVLELLQAHNVTPVVFHWFSGSIKVMNEIADAGHYFSVNTAMIYSEKGKKLVDKIPPERLLAETDGPFIKSQRGEPVKPEDTDSVYAYLAKSWQQPLDVIQTTLQQNFVRVLKQCYVHSSQIGR